MKKALIVTLPLAALALALAVTSGIAAEDGADEPVKVIITGENYCLLCALAPDEAKGANATYAKMNALKVTQAEDEFNMMMTELEGMTLHYLPNKIGQALMVNPDLTGKTVKITGHYFQKAATIQVLTYEEVDTSDDFSWDEPAVGKKSKKKIF